MRIISFAWTTPALLAGRKTCTRRDWMADYAQRFTVGELVAAYDRSPRAGGKQVAVIRLTADPILSNELPAKDWAAEGFDYLEEIGAKVNGNTPLQLWDAWFKTKPYQWIVRFEVVEEEPSK